MNMSKSLVYFLLFASITSAYAESVALDKPISTTQTKGLAADAADFPAVNPILVAAHDGRDKVGPTIQVVHGKGMGFLVARRRSHQDGVDLDLVLRGSFHQRVGPVPFPRSLRRLEVTPLGKQTDRGDAGRGHLRKPLGDVAR